MKLNKCAILFCCLFMLSACGFHLRGYQTLPPQLRNLVIQAPNFYDPLVLQLKQILSSSGVVISEVPHSAEYTLAILGIQFNQQLINISANTFVKTYNLQYQVSIELVNNQGKVIYGPQAVTATSSYVVNASQLLGDNSVLNTQKQSLIQQAVSQILNRLNSLEVRDKLNK